MRPALLDETARDAALDELNHASEAPWHVENGALHKQFRFDNFRAAFAFMNRVARHADALDHHPDWRNVYNRVSVTLSTHDAGGLTGLDFRLARMMDEEAASPAR